MIAVFERFHRELAKIPDPAAARLCENWKAARVNYSNPPPGVKRSQLALGLEQGLREIPLLLGPFATQHRTVAARAYHAALEAEYPAFLQTERERLAKVLSRGRISGESEFILVRHVIDIGEEGGTDFSTLAQLYRLVDSFEAKGRRGA